MQKASTEGNPLTDHCYDSTQINDFRRCPECDKGPFQFPRGLSTHRYRMHGVRGPSRLTREAAKPRQPAPTATVCPTALDIAWGAGIIEGEGCIHTRKFYYTKATKGKPARRHKPQLEIVVAMTDLDTIDRLQKMFGGRLGERKRTKKMQSYKDFYYWQVLNERAYGIGLTIFSFLGVRRRLQFLTYVTAHKAWRNQHV